MLDSQLTDISGSGLTEEPLGEAMLGPFEHRLFKEKSSWIPENTPNMVESLVSINELCLAKTKIHAPLRQNLNKSKRIIE